MVRPRDDDDYAGASVEGKAKVSVRGMFFHNKVWALRGRVASVGAMMHLVLAGAMLGR